ncbi:uncharacterized protein L203_106398 [Cryptococcus depauperatus CBS 7841]|uniref:Zn(2)-C6 fungal-type domain-containing protein n=1 Tax=Cryptococcus depauperatus CBS 7841 TaxID=1295531 RepID=A0AAJ8JZG0_9TREE
MPSTPVKLGKKASIVRSTTALAKKKSMVQSLTPSKSKPSCRNLRMLKQHACQKSPEKCNGKPARNRQIKSCDVCVDRKKKCDCYAHQPCSFCRERGFECVIHGIQVSDYLATEQVMERQGKGIAFRKSKGRLFEYNRESQDVRQGFYEEAHITAPGLSSPFGDLHASEALLQLAGPNQEMSYPDSTRMVYNAQQPFLTIPPYATHDCSSGYDYNHGVCYEFSTPTGTQASFDSFPDERLKLSSQSPSFAPSFAPEAAPEAAPEPTIDPALIYGSPQCVDGAAFGTHLTMNQHSTLSPHLFLSERPGIDMMVDDYTRCNFYP